MTIFYVMMSLLALIGMLATALGYASLHASFVCVNPWLRTEHRVSGLTISTCGVVMLLAVCYIVGLTH
jgi:uncharacterized membrane protein